VHWVMAPADDLDGDRRVPYPADVPAGLIPAGAIGDYLLEHGTVPVHCASMTVRPAALRALGGWAGVPRSDDVSVLMALSELTDGYLLPDVTWLYRRHPRQTINTGWWQELAGDSLRHVTQRLLAVRELKLVLAG
jgi:hypothetical protein